MDTHVPMLPRLDLIRVEAAMQQTLIGRDPAATPARVAGIFAEERIHCVIVTGIERTVRGERFTWGIVTDRDLLPALDVARAADGA